MSTRIRCAFCTKTFFKNSEYYIHANQRHLPTIATSWRCCSACNYYFPNADELQIHQNSAHSKRGKKRCARCDFCDSAFTNNLTLYKHCNSQHTEQISEDWHLCKFCRMFFPSAVILKAHMVDSHAKNINQEGEKHNLSCTFCSKIFNTEYNFYQHSNIEHRDEIVKRWFPCDACGEHRPTKDLLDRHKEVHGNDPVSTNERRKCEFCSSVFSIKSQAYYKHANKDHEEIISSEWEPCDICSSYFPSESETKSHKLMIHLLNKFGSETFKCIFCNCAFGKVSMYYKHCNTDHLTECERVWIKCNDCKFFFPNGAILRRHVSSTHLSANMSGPSLAANRVQCKYCPASFSRAQRYLKHANSVHIDKIIHDWFKCNYCSIFQPSFIALKSHTNASHKKEQNIKERLIMCQFCKLCFFDNLNYYNHVNLKHEAAVKKSWLVCKFCKLFVPNQVALKYHEYNTHAFKSDCQFCKQGFTDSNEFFYHSNTIHKIEIASKWKHCIFCQNFYPSDAVLAGHDCQSRCSICQFCKKLFQSPTVFVQHANKDHFSQVSKTWHKCASCSVFLPSTDALADHMTKSHKCSKEVVSCHFCKHQCETEGSYYDHANQSHLINIMETWEFCDHCFCYFPNTLVLQEHDCVRMDAYDLSEDEEEEEEFSSKFTVGNNLAIHSRNRGKTSSLIAYESNELMDHDKLESSSSDDENPCADDVETFEDTFSCENSAV